MKERIYLVGYMACGKTTLGRALASRMGWDFLDLDAEIERLEGATVSNVIAEKGLEYFRNLESQLLVKTSALRNTVLACGGGTPCREGNMEFMNEHGLTVWLKASPERTAIRVRQAGDTRPLLSKIPDEGLVEHIRDHIEERSKYYSRAKLAFDSERLENEREINESVEQFILMASDFLPPPTR